MMLLADLIGTTVLYGVHHGQKCHRSVCLWIDHSLSRVINHPGRQLYHIVNKMARGRLTNRSSSKEKQAFGVCTWNYSSSSQNRSVWTCTASAHPQAPHVSKRVLDTKLSLVHVCEEQGNICFPGEGTDLAGTMWLAMNQSLLLGGSIKANGTVYLINVTTRGLRSGQGKGKCWFI